MKKWIVGIALVAGGIYLASNPYVRDYVRLAWNGLGQHARENIPLETRIAKARLNLEDRQLQFDALLKRVARKQTEAEKLEREVGVAERNLNRDRAALKTLLTGVKAQQQLVSYNGDDLPLARAKEVLQREADQFEQRQEDFTARKEELAARQEELKVLDEQITAWRQQDRELVRRIRELDASLRRLELEKIKTPVAQGKTDLDRLARDLDQIETDISAESKLRGLREQYRGEGPARPAAQPARPLNEIETLLQPGAKQEDKVSQR